MKFTYKYKRLSLLYTATTCMSFLLIGCNPQKHIDENLYVFDDATYKVYESDKSVNEVWGELSNLRRDYLFPEFELLTADIEGIYGTRQMLYNSENNIRLISVSDTRLIIDNGSEYMLLTKFVPLPNYKSEDLTGCRITMQDVSGDGKKELIIDGVIVTPGGSKNFMYVVDIDKLCELSLPGEEEINKGIESFITDSSVFMDGDVVKYKFTDANENVYSGEYHDNTSFADPLNPDVNIDEVMLDFTVNHSKGYGLVYFVSDGKVHCEYLINHTEHYISAICEINSQGDSLEVKRYNIR